MKAKSRRARSSPESKKVMQAIGWIVALVACGFLVWGLGDFLATLSAQSAGILGS